MKYCCGEFKEAIKDKEILKTGNGYYKPNVYINDFWKDVLNVILSECPFCETPIGAINELRAKLNGLRQEK